MYLDIVIHHWRKGNGKTQNNLSLLFTRCCPRIWFAAYKKQVAWTNFDENKWHNILGGILENLKVLLFLHFINDTSASTCQI